jgi:uncharacterized protein (TIGR02246 family)
MQKTDWWETQIRLAPRDDVTSIRKLSAEWLKAEHDRDLDGLLHMVTDDVVFLRPNAPSLEGRQAVEDLFRAVWASFSIHHTVRIREIRVQEDWAWTVTDETLHFTPKNDGPCFRLSGSGMAILRRHPDGGWRYARAITNLLPERK